MASFHEHDDQFPNSPPAPSVASGDTSTRDAGDAGSPPPASSGCRPEQADPSLPASSEAASHTLLPLELERALRLADDLLDLEDVIGQIPIGITKMPRPAFEALEAFHEHYVRTRSTESGFFWAKYVYTPKGRVLQCFCMEPPAGWVTPAGLPPLCTDCGAELVPGVRYPGSDELCRRCEAARAAGEDADLEAGVG